MASYLHPGGTSYKLNHTEKQAFVFKIKNLAKPIIADCIMKCISRKVDHMITFVNVKSNT